ncbi:PAS domain-containing protein (plasmid) [Streptomyces sp. JL4002]|uniref:PAS domain-containing protein n=1 Tax=Streptomyces sp. JL4002 TaxID=3404781 RepID=UPI003B28D887
MQKSFEECISKLPVAAWETDLNLKLKEVANGPRVNYFTRPFASHLLPMREFSFSPGQAQQEDIDAHIRARAGEPVVWRMGSSGELLASVAPIFSEQDGEIVGVAGIAVDLSEFEERVGYGEEMAALFHSLAEASPAKICITGPDGRVLFSNSNSNCMQSLGSHADAQEDSGEGEIDPHPKSIRRAVEMGGKPAVLKIEPVVLVPPVDDAADNVSNNNQNEASAEKFREVFAAVRLPQIYVQNGMIIDCNPAWVQMFGGEPNGGFTGTEVESWISNRSDSSNRDVGDSASTQKILFVLPGQNAIAADVEIVEYGYDTSGQCWIVHRWGNPAETILADRFGNIPEVDGKILELLALGFDNAQIALGACLSRQGLDYRIRNLKKMIGAESRGALVAKAYHLGLLEAHEWPPRFSSP